MRARWVSPTPSPKFPIVGQAIVASFLPWKFYHVLTVCHDASDPGSLSALSRKMRAVALGVAPDELPEEYTTMVRRCNRDGVSRPSDPFLFERAYSDMSQALEGHNEVLDLLSRGKLRLHRDLGFRS